ncbi:MAG: SAM-dependent methyltransferase [Chlamydiota bacterium]
MLNKPALILLPNLLAKVDDHQDFLPPSVDRAVASLDGLISESPQQGRSYLKRFQTKLPPYEMPIAVFNKKTPDRDIDFLLEPIIKGERWGYVSDAGLPCIADPGSKLVWRARRHDIAVESYIGPSSLMIALMLSGLPAQSFNFHGYIAKDPRQRQKEIMLWEKESRHDNNTQAFIEAPFRNNHTLQALLSSLQDNTLLCVAWDLTLPSQQVLCCSIKQWKEQELPDLKKKPATFLFYGGSRR